ncbi:MAG TPA: hypothetical protein VFL94_12210 [Actinomycetales bacterium]|nr:hypothetical protein [Actinomycetales bacterium]
MTGRHRGGRSLRRRLVVAVLAAAIGRGYVGRHRLAEVALGVEPDTRTREVVVAAPPVQPVPHGRSSVAPWLRVVPAPPQPDQLADTLPHPVVTLFPLPPTSTPAVPASGETAEEQVFSLVDAEREEAVMAELAAGADVRPYRARHTA